MEQSKLMLSRERQSEATQRQDSAVCLHPPKVQMRTDSYTRCLEISHSFFGRQETGEKECISTIQIASHL